MIQNNEDCHYINVTESFNEIKLEWNDIIIKTTKGIFYNCTETVEIDMTKFDTSFVTDMSDMFALCDSLKSLNVSNFDTRNVQTMENMFYQRTNLTSLNLESFEISKVTSLYRMFYGCINLEHINIKNFEEKQNTNLNGMFYNIAPNSVICLSQSPPPTNFTIISMSSKQATVSWIGYEWNNFIISYGPQNLSNPDDGTEININNTLNYTLRDLVDGIRYDIYIKTDCGDKSSYWIGPLLVSIESYNLPHIGSDSIRTCSKIIYDSGGPNGDYQNYANSILTIYPETSGKMISLTGTVSLEINYDYLYIYDGEKTSEQYTFQYNGNTTLPLYVSTSGPLTLKSTSDYSILYPGFHLTIGCMNNWKTMYDIIKSNNYTKISCDSNWRSIQNLILSDSGICIRNCSLTNNTYQYRGKCYINCPDDTTDINQICYSNSIIEKCEEYSMESDDDNLCIKCKNNYFPILNDKNNKNGFINCYKNNTLEKYYLDKSNLHFKPCYNSCKACIKSGTKEYHNCITCDINYEFNLSFGEYYNCYPKCDYYYYFDNDNNLICLNKTECPKEYINLIEEKNQCIEECYKDSEFKYQFRKKCYKVCPIDISYESESKNYFCEVICNKEKPFEIIEFQNCTDFCRINEMNNKSCISKYKDEETNGYLIVHNFIQEITSDFDISILNNNETIIINESFISFIITYNKRDTNNFINLGQCEDILKQY